MDDKKFTDEVTAYVKTITDKLKVLGDKQKSMSTSEIADYLELKGDDRATFIQSAVAAKSAWEEASKGIRKWRAPSMDGHHGKFKPYVTNYKLEKAKG